MDFWLQVAVVRSIVYYEENVVPSNIIPRTSSMRVPSLAHTIADNSHNTLKSCCTKVRQSPVAHEISCHYASFIAQQVFCMIVETVKVTNTNISEHNLMGEP